MELIRQAVGVAVKTGTDLHEVRLILGIGRNYAEHAKEQAADIPTRPMVFTKSPMTACLQGDPIIVPKVCQERPQVDFEAELAVVIGEGPNGEACRDVPEGRALEWVLGYTCGNDVSARWWQKEGSGGQFYRGKSFDTFCPLGPRLVPGREIKDPQALSIRCRVNGQVMQDGTTKDMIFSVANLIADLSRGATLPAGTVIMTGTPSGVGFARKPPVWLGHGDKVEVEIAGIGVLANTVQFE